MADNKNDLSDLVVDQGADNSNSDKKKKIIVGVIAVVVIFLVVLGVMWQLNIGGFGEDEKQNALTSALNETPPKTDLPPVDKEITESTTELPINTEKNTGDDDEVLLNGEGADDENNELAVDKNAGGDDIISEELPEDVTPDEEGSIDTVVKEAKKVKLKKSEPASVSEDLDNSKDITEEINTDETIEKAVKSAKLGKGFYIQVSANQKRKPSNSFIKEYKKNGYSVHSLKISVGGVKTTKVLVGPYSKKSEAKEILSEIKADREDAFLYFVR